MSDKLIQKRYDDIDFSVNKYTYTPKMYDMMRIIGRDNSMVLMTGFAPLPNVWFEEDEHFSFSNIPGYKTAPEVKYIK